MCVSPDQVIACFTARPANASMPQSTRRASMATPLNERRWRLRLYHWRLGHEPGRLDVGSHLNWLRNKKRIIETPKGLILGK
jgi:hypothetical protein